MSKKLKSCWIVGLSLGETRIASGGWSFEILTVQCGIWVGSLLSISCWDVRRKNKRQKWIVDILWLGLIFHNRYV